jgi:hypothetical protein
MEPNASYNIRKNILQTNRNVYGQAISKNGLGGYISMHCARAIMQL